MTTSRWLRLGLLLLTECDHHSYASMCCCVLIQAESLIESASFYEPLKNFCWGSNNNDTLCVLVINYTADKVMLKLVKLKCVCAYRMCAKNSDDLGQGHVPQLLREGSGDQPLGCVEDVVLHNKEANRHKKEEKPMMNAFTAWDNVTFTLGENAIIIIISPNYLVEVSSVAFHCFMLKTKTTVFGIRWSLT